MARMRATARDLVLGIVFMPRSAAPIEGQEQGPPEGDEVEPDPDGGGYPHDPDPHQGGEHRHGAQVDDPLMVGQVGQGSYHPSVSSAGGDPCSSMNALREPEMSRPGATRLSRELRWGLAVLMGRVKMPDRLAGSGVPEGT